MKTDYEFKQFINELLDKTSSINSCTVQKAWGTLYIGEVNGRSLSICFQTAVKNHVQRSMLSTDENLSILTVKSCDLEILVYSLDKYSIKNINTPEEEAARFVELDVKQPQLEKFIQEQLEIIRINPHFLTEPKDFCTVTINQKRINES